MFFILKDNAILILQILLVVEEVHEYIVETF